MTSTLPPSTSDHVDAAPSPVLDVPLSVLDVATVERGSNPSEAAYLSDAAEQARLADVLVDATMEYLAQLDRRTGGGHP